jgi:hypothetical protein
VETPVPDAQTLSKRDGKCKLPYMVCGHQTFMVMKIRKLTKSSPIPQCCMRFLSKSHKADKQRYTYPPYSDRWFSDNVTSQTVKGKM